MGAVILSGDVYEPPVLYQTLPIGNACRPVRLCTLATGGAVIPVFTLVNEGPERFLNKEV